MGLSAFLRTSTAAAASIPPARNAISPLVLRQQTANTYTLEPPSESRITGGFYGPTGKKYPARTLSQRAHVAPHGYRSPGQPSVRAGKTQQAPPQITPLQSGSALTHRRTGTPTQSRLADDYPIGRSRQPTSARFEHACSTSSTHSGLNTTGADPERRQMNLAKLQTMLLQTTHALMTPHQGSCGLQSASANQLGECTR